MLIDEIYRHSIQMPQKTALKDISKERTYLELFNNIKRISSFLKSNSLLQKSDGALIVCNKNIHALEWILGVLALDAFFIPVDIKNPIHRIEKVIQEAKPKIIICSHEIYEELKQLQIKTIKIINIDDIQINKLALPDKFEIIENKDSSIVYTIYTSGSTSIPKGVPITNKNIYYFFQDIGEFYKVTNQSRCLNTSSFSFDVFLLDTLYPLFIGAFVYITTDMLIPSLIKKILLEEKITNLCAVSSKLTLITNSLTREEYFLKYIMTGAEPLNRKTIETLIDLLPGVKIINGYGPTEATCTCICYEINKENIKNTLSCIGKPLNNITTLILDKNKNISDHGELLLSGSQVMNGYLNKNNNEDFIKINNYFFYKTGDICERDKEGKLYYLGRKNEQVKYRGYRVNLNEINDYIRKLVYVKDSIVLLVDQELIVYINFKTAPLDYKTIKSDLKSFLPDYLIPEKYKNIKKFPYLPSGKKDIQTLKTYLLKGSNNDRIKL